MSQRTQWVVVLASFFAINGVLATFFLSRINDSTANESALSVRGTASADAESTSSTVAAFVATPNAASGESPSTALTPTTEPPTTTVAVSTSVDVTPTDDQANSDDSDTTDSSSTDDASDDDVSPSAGDSSDEDPVDLSEADATTAYAGEESPELDPESAAGDDVDRDLEVPSPVTSDESTDDVDASTSEAAPDEAAAEPASKPVSSSFSAPQSEGTTPVAHATVSRIAARGGPSADSPVLATFSHPTPRGGELVFQATGISSTTGALGVDEEEWIEVLLPVRPNGTKGWIKRSQVKLTVNPYRIDIDLSRHELVVYRNDEQRLSTAIGVGKGGTPTPIGGFFLTELLRPSNPSGAYGPYAYGLSGYSDTLTSFNGGPGVIGIHGTNKPSLLGSDVSHGCIRVANPVITKMAEFLPLGTPVNIKQ